MYLCAGICINELYIHTHIHIYMVDAEEIKMKWKQELYKKDPNEPDYYDGVISLS